MKDVWYIIHIPPDCRGPQGQPAMSHEYHIEIEEWITDLYQNTNLKFIWYNDRVLSYQFNSEEVAMIFKLRWS